LALVIVIGFGGYRLYRAINPIPYSASAYGFSINFPETPTVTNIPSQKDSTGGTESGTVYDVVDAVTKDVYIVDVIHYSDASAASLSTNDTRAALLADASQMAQTYKLTLQRTSFTTFNSLTALEAVFVPTNKSASPTDLFTFLKKNNSYTILGSGMSAAKFTTFVHSFRFSN
jgi:hypothetical protein